MTDQVRPDGARLAFIGGMGRSGTTLLRNMLDSHPEVASGPEFDLLPDVVDLHRKFQKKRKSGRIADYLTETEINDLFARLVDGALFNYAEKRDRRLLVEKTPVNVWHFPELGRILPQAKFIHMIRDGRDVAASFMAVGRRRAGQGKRVDRQPELTSIFHCARLWQRTVDFGLKAAAGLAERCLLVRYEDLVADPRDEMERICRFLGVGFNPAVLEHHRHEHDTIVDDVWYTAEDYQRPVSTESVARWQREWSRWDRLLFAAAGEKALEKLGYVSTSGWVNDDGRPAGRAITSAVRAAAKAHWPLSAMAHRLRTGLGRTGRTAA